jgi:hypothetical protein
MGMPRTPGYDNGMDAKTRYRRRLKLQAALTRVMELLAENVGDGIRPDATTALMAAQVIAKLIPFGTAAGLGPQELLPDKSNLSRFQKHIKDRQRETAARRQRRKREHDRQANQARDPR